MPRHEDFDGYGNTVLHQLKKFIDVVGLYEVCDIRSVCPDRSDFYGEMLEDIEEECRRFVEVVDSDHSVLILKSPKN